MVHSSERLPSFCLGSVSMYEQANLTCMRFTLSAAPVVGNFLTSLGLTSAKLRANSCFNCGCKPFPMSAIPQGAFIAAKIRQNEKKRSEQDSFYGMNRNMEPTPLQYNSKMMNSIWGLYNRYSVHNFKKNIDKNMAVGTMNQQIQSVGSTSGGAKGATSMQVLTGTWDKLRSTFGHPH